MSTAPFDLSSVVLACGPQREASSLSAWIKGDAK